jgi:hypothetical protein
MGYANQSRQGLVSPDSLATVLLSGVTDNLRLFRIFGPITVHRVGFLITTATTVTAPIVDWDRRITPGSDTGRVDKGVTTMTFPAVALGVIGAVIYKNVLVDLSAGDEVTVQVTTAATAGAGIPFLEFVARDEVPANQPDMVAAT